MTNRKQNIERSIRYGIAAVLIVAFSSYWHSTRPLVTCQVCKESMIKTDTHCPVTFTWKMGPFGRSESRVMWIWKCVNDHYPIWATESGAWREWQISGCGSARDGLNE